MTYLVLVIVACGMGAWGYWRGGLRVLVRMAPLLMASVLCWLFSGWLYRSEFITSSGLAWPFILPTVIGVAGGYVLQFFVRKKLPKNPHRVDRIAGATICTLMAVVMVWLGSLFFALRGSAAAGMLTADDTGPARMLNSAIVRWIPAVGTGSDSLMSVVEIASADETVRQKAVDNLKIDHLLGSETFLKMKDDAATYDDLVAASNGSLLALWRLQKNPLVYDFYKSSEMQDVLARLTLADIAQAVRDAKNAP